MRYTGFLTVSALLLTAAAPAPLQRGGGWPAWNSRMDGIRQAILDVNINSLDVYCSGMKDTLHNSGMKFPAWAMAARDGCLAAHNVMEGSYGSRVRDRIVCRDVKRAANMLLKAKEAPDVPSGAAAKARSLGTLLLQVRDAACFGKVPK